MGLFGNNFAKEGPGVRKGGPEKKRFFLFFELYFRKFWKLVQLNLLYVACMVPFFVIAYYVARAFPPSFTFLTLFIPIIGMGPFTAGFTYVLRNFAREQHSFLFSDFFEHTRKNIGQSLIVSTASALLLYLIVVSCQFYSANISASSFFLIPFAITIFMTIVILFMHYYLYMMVVTFELNILQLYKNAFIFAVLGLKNNLLTTFWLIVVGGVLFLFFPLTLLLILPIGLSTLGFIINFNAYPTVKKYLIDPYYEKLRAENPEPEEEEEIDDTVFSDDLVFDESSPDDLKNTWNARK